jgi:hypothetical protein
MILDELKTREAELEKELEPMKDRYVRLTTELAMVRHGIFMLSPKPADGRGRRRIPAAVLDEAKEMRKRGIVWEEIALKMGTSVAAIQKAVERHEKNNPHLKVKG